MSSQVLYPHTPSTPIHGHSSTATATASARTAANSSAHNPISHRPRRAAAIASQAATLAVSTSKRKSQSSKTSGSSSSTLPQTPQNHHHAPHFEESVVYRPEQHTSTGDSAQTTTRPMAALPRAKRARRGEATESNVSHAGSNGSAISSAPYVAGSSTIEAAAAPAASKYSIMMGIDSALNGHLARTQADQNRSELSSSKSRGSGFGSSVREMIGGQEREVFVVDSTSPVAGATRQGYGQDDGHHSRSTKGKRKAAGSPSAAEATSRIEHSAPSAASKRRRKEPGAGQAQDPSAYKDDAVRTLYTGNGDPSMINYPTLASKGQPAALASYRGGYNAGNAYYKQQQQQQPKNGVVSYPPLAHPSVPQPKYPVDDPEGHFIVREGEQVTERYRIVSLLGQGTFGKVVKCKDMTSPRQVAIKIIRAVQKYTDAAQIEIRVLRTLRDSDPWNEYKCIHLLDTFTYLNHVCIVSELLGQSVFDFLKDNDFNPFPPRHIWSFAKQLLRSVAFLHGLGLVHTDLKPENILLVNSNYDLVPITWRANSRKKRVLQDTDIRLIDFGSATFNEEYHSQVVSTRHYRAPEIILQMGWSYPCDAWSIGCILIEFYTGEALFQTHDNLEHLAMMEAVLGPMPDDFRRKAETYRPNYFRAGRLDFPNSTTNRQSRKYVKGMKALDDTVNSPQAYSKHDQRFKHLLKRLLTFDPNQRIRVEQALNHPYFDLAEHEIPP